MQAPCSGWPPAQSTVFWAASSGVGRFCAPRSGVAAGGLRQGNVLAGAGAGVGQARHGQLLQRGLVERPALRLPLRRLVRVQPAGGQLLQDQLVGAGHAARRVHVFHAHQPAPAQRPRVQPTGQRRHQRTRVQRPGGRGGKAANGHAMLRRSTGGVPAWRGASRVIAAAPRTGRRWPELPAGALAKLSFWGGRALRLDRGQGQVQP